MFTRTTRLKAVRGRLLATTALMVVALAPPLALGAVHAGSASAAYASASVDRVLKDPAIVESSGLARSHRTSGVLWTHNDSGGGDVIYAVNTAGTTIARYTVTGASHKDWEGMASAVSGSTSYVYVGDLGGQRTSVFVHRVVEPTSLTGGSLTPTTWELTYPDGAHNSETLLVHPTTKRIYVVTKQLSGAAIYAAPTTLSTTSPNRLTRVASAPSGLKLSDGAFLDDGRLVLRGYMRCYLYSSIGATPRYFGLPESGESITPGFTAGTLYTGSEGRSSRVWKVLIP